MSGVRIGVQLASLRLPFKQALHTAAQLGVQGIEIDARTELRPSDLSGTGLRQVKKLLNDLDLRVVSIRFRTRRGYDTTEDLDRRVSSTKEAMKMAYDLGAPLVVNQVGLIGPEPQDETHATLRSVLDDFGRFGQRVGAILACETGSEPLSYISKMIDSLPDATLGIALNPGNLLVNGFDLDDLPRAAQYIRLVHAKDGVRDLARGRGMEVPLGRGLAEFPQIAATLEERRYQGYYVVEREISTQPLEDVAQAIQFLKNM